MEKGEEIKRERKRKERELLAFTLTLHT